MNERDRILGYERKTRCGDEERWKGNYTHGDGERENARKRDASCSITILMFNA